MRADLCRDSKSTKDIYIYIFSHYFPKSVAEPEPGTQNYIMFLVFGFGFLDYPLSHPLRMGLSAHFYNGSIIGSSRPNRNRNAPSQFEAEIIARKQRERLKPSS
jgi:hypothetical protein